MRYEFELLNTMNTTEVVEGFQVLRLAILPITESDKEKLIRLWGTDAGDCTRWLLTAQSTEDAGECEISVELIPIADDGSGPRDTSIASDFNLPWEATFQRYLDKSEAGIDMLD